MAITFKDIKHCGAGESLNNKMTKITQGLTDRFYIRALRGERSDFR